MGLVGSIQHWQRRERLIVIVIIRKKDHHGTRQKSVLEEAVMAEDKDLDDSSTSCRRTSHLKSGFTHMEV